MFFVNKTCHFAHTSQSSLTANRDSFGLRCKLLRRKGSQKYGQKKDAIVCILFGKNENTKKHYLWRTYDKAGTNQKT